MEINLELTKEMKSAKGRHQDPEEEEDEEFGSAKKENLPSNDGKNIEKANAIRSKHSVTEQRRRCKINERFQILRDLIPHSDQKRDTASFLLEVIEYVKFLQDTVQKYEGSYQGWASEPTKLMPWRNSHWRVHSFVGHPQAIKNDSSPGATYPGRFDDNNVTMLTNTQNPIETDPRRDGSCKAVDQEPELANKEVTVPILLQPSMSVPAQADSLYSHSLPRPVSEMQPAGYPIISDAPNHNEELTIEGGTISISSAYSQGLLDSLTQALQVAGLDLSQATISIQIDLGKRANKKLTSGMSVAKDHENSPSGIQPLGNLQSASNGEDSDQAQKRRKI